MALRGAALQHAFLLAIRGWPDAHQLDADTGAKSLANEARTVTLQVLPNPA
jgi:hypothetical protein